MVKPFQIGPYTIGEDTPAFCIAEAGINHNADIEIAKKLIDVAADAGCQLVKFQKRTPQLCVPESEWFKTRKTPWGWMTYLTYRNKMEFSVHDYSVIADHCEKRGILWTASAWDVPSVQFLEGFDVPCHKVPSACLTNHALLRAMKRTGKPVIVSTGMSTTDEIEEAVKIINDGLPPHPMVLMHCTSTYPCPLAELNLRCISTLAAQYPTITIGYSGHESGIPTTVAAVALGAKVIERHITLDRTMWGGDHAASLEPMGLKRLVGYIRAIEQAMGDGVKQVYTSEEPVKVKLRKEVWS